MKVEFFKHSLGNDELNALSGVLASTFLTTGPRVAEFEVAFGNYLGVPNVVTTNSCTSALLLTLKALGIGPGDEVITTPLTFAATINSILYTGATPVLVDVEAATGNIDVNKVFAAFNSNTKAVIGVHLYGSMFDVVSLQALCVARGVHLIEDAAHCVEGKRYGLRPGMNSTAACFSFYATKNITCGEGGAVATRDAALAARIKTLRLHGMSKDAANRYNTDKFSHYEITELGYKANLTDVQAALLLPQLPKISSNLARRSEIYKRYYEGLKDVVRFPTIVGDSAMHLFTIWMASAERDRIASDLVQRGIGVGVHYRPVHKLQYAAKYLKEYTKAVFPFADGIGFSTISLPFYPALRDDEIDYVVKSIKELL